MTLEWTPQHDRQETQTWVVGATCIRSWVEHLPDGGRHGAVGAAPRGEVPHAGSNGLSVARGPSPKQTVRRHPAEGGGGGLPQAAPQASPPGQPFRHLLLPAQGRGPSALGCQGLLCVLRWERCQPGSTFPAAVLSCSRLLLCGNETTLVKDLGCLKGNHLANFGVNFCKLNADNQ